MADLGNGKSGSGKRTRWTAEEFERVFSDFPPTGKPPSQADLQRLASELKRTPDAIGWVWEDGKGLLARKKGTSSRAQREYMIERWRAPRLDDEPAPGSADVLVLGCVKSKLEGSHPAADLYVSPLWRKRRRHAELSGKPWYVFSSAYGLLDSTTVVETYDQRLDDLPPAEQKARGERAIRELEQRIGDLRGKVVEVHGGSAYVNALRAPLKTRGSILSVPLAFLGIGSQMHWYDTADGVEQPKPVPRARLAGAQHATPSLHLPAAEIPTAIPEHLHGLALRITTEFNEHRFDLTGRGSHEQGWHGMPEIAAAKRIRAEGGSDIDVRLWLTFTVALDKVRDADQLATTTIQLWLTQRWMFDPIEVAERSVAEIRDVLMGTHVSRFHWPDAGIWRRIAISLTSPAGSLVRRAVFDGEGDACDLLATVVQRDPSGRALFPSLRGPRSRGYGSEN